MVKRRSYKAAIKKLRPFVKGAVAGTVTAAVFTVIGAFLFNIADAPSGADSVMAYVSLGASAVVCGMFFGGGRGKNGFAWGTLGGLAMPKTAHFELLSERTLQKAGISVDLPERNFCLS